MTDKPIEVGASPMPNLAMTALRYAGASLATLLVAKGWLVGDQSEAVTGALTGLATVGWALYRTWSEHRKLVVTANAAPDRIAKVKS